MAEETHYAVVTVTPGAPLQLISLPTPVPIGNEVRVRVLWTANSPFDLHQSDGHLLATPPQVLGENTAGIVTTLGPEVRNLKVGDEVFGYTFRSQKERSHQETVVVSENLLGKIPEGFSMQQAVTVPDNFVTMLNVAIADFGIEFPWPKPDDYVPEHANEPILIWGGSSSSGMYALQVLKWLGYTNLIAVASEKHHSKLKKYGASRCIDYRDGTEETVKHINKLQDEQGKPIRYILDCIGSLEGSLRPIAKIARSGCIMAVLLPIIVKDAAEGVKPDYSFDVQGSADWVEGVKVKGVRTHFYLDSTFLAEKGQAEIMPAALKMGIIEPNEQVVVEGNTLLERAEKAMGMLRSKAVSGQRLVWRVAEE